MKYVELLSGWLSDGVRVVTLFVLSHPHDVAYVVGGLAVVSALATLRAMRARQDHSARQPTPSQPPAPLRPTRAPESRGLVPLAGPARKRTPSKAALVHKLVSEGNSRAEIARKTRLPYDVVAMITSSSA